MASTSPARIAETETRERREREAVASQPKVIGAKHILIMHAESASKPETVTRSKAEGMKRAQMVLAKVRAGAKFEDLAKEFSDEPGASERGGDLGVFDRATMVPSFGNAAFALPVGGVSEIVETKFGFHIIKRTE